MPFGILLLALDAALVIHAAKTGRLTPWAYVIMLLPGIGAAAYILIELAPEWLGSYKGQKAQLAVARTLNPEGRYRQLKDQLDIVDTIANRIGLAEECLDIKRFDEAFQLYEGVTKLPLGDEPQYFVGKARAELGLNRPEDAVATLESVRANWPQYETADGHLLYAKALEAAGRDDEALHEYAEVGAYYPGAEPRVLQAAMLKRLGRDADAKAVAADVALRLKRAPKHVRRAQAQWLAEANRLARE